MASLFGVMTVGALIPGISVMTVVSRSVTYGFYHGALTTLGIATVDTLYILVALLGLSILAQSLGNYFVVIKYLGGGYLIGLGVSLWRSNARLAPTGESGDGSLLSSFLSGFMITLADQKAILFYFGFFPAWLDRSNISLVDTVIIILIAVSAITTKLVYIWLAFRAVNLANHVAATPYIKLLAGFVMVGAGVFLWMT